MWSLLFSLLGAFLLAPGAIGNLTNITTDNSKHPRIPVLLILLIFHFTAVTSTSASVLGNMKAASRWYNTNLGNNSFIATTSSKASAQSPLSV